MPDTTVPVPDDRIAEFYQFFGLWLAGSLSLPGSPSVTPVEVSPDIPGPSKPAMMPWGVTELDLADAVSLWQKYSSRARAMFGLLIDNPNKEFTGNQIAEACHIPNGAHGVAGVLAWPGRHGAAIGRQMPTSFREDPDTLESFYFVPAATAELFKAAREKVERAD
jgi:hypothetical protein